MHPTLVAALAGERITVSVSGLRARIAASTLRTTEVCCA